MINIHHFQYTDKQKCDFLEEYGYKLKEKAYKKFEHNIELEWKILHVWNGHHMLDVRSDYDRDYMSHVDYIFYDIIHKWTLKTILKERHGR